MGKEKELRAPKLYKIEKDLGVAFMDLQAHIMEFNRQFKTAWSLTNSRRKTLGATIGKASDNNHLLYQTHIDLILENCPRPITVDAIVQALVQSGEKPSTARLLAPSYFKHISYILNPQTKLHRMSTKSLERYGQF